VLHIEDNASNRKVVEHIFRAVDLRLAEAVDGPAGLAQARALRPDLVLLDMQLPGLSGYDVVARLKADAATRHIPVLAVTSYALHGDDEAALRAGCDAYLAKPFRPRQLLAAMARFLPQLAAAEGGTEEAETP
jgi:two-component system cell cycle response regulator DivK